MTDPKRLLELPGLGPLERLALEEARAMQPPAELREEVWRALGAAVLPVAAGAGATVALSEGGAAGAHAAASTAAGGNAAAGAASHAAFAVLPGLKVMAAVAAIWVSAAGAGFVVGRMWSQSADVPAKADVAAIAQASSADAPVQSRGTTESASAPHAGFRELSPAERTPAIAAVAIPEPPVAGNGSGALAEPPAGGMRDGASSRAPRALAATPANRAKGQAAASRSTFEAAPAASEGPRAVAGMAPVASEGAPLVAAVEDRESSLVTAAREALRAGDPARALALLDHAKELGPKGVLVQERELLGIEALVRLEERDAARDRARAFLRTWPDSPYAGHVQAMLSR